MRDIGFLAGIINALADPVFVKDRGSRILLVNDAFCQFNGRSRAELLGKTAHDLFPVAQADVLAAHSEQVFITGKEIVTEETVTNAFGETRRILSKKTLCRDEQGNPVLVGVFRDITKQKQTEEQLAGALVFQRTLLEAAPIGIVCCKPDGEIISVNIAAAEIAGGSVEQISRLNVRQLPSAQQSGIVAALDEVLATGHEVRREFKVVTSFGKRLCLHGRIALFSHHGERFLILLGMDITERKQAEEARLKVLTERKNAELALRESEALYQSLVQNLPCGIARKDAAGRYVYVNDRFCQQDGIKADLILGKTPVEFEQSLLEKHRHVSAQTVKQLIHLANRGAENHRRVMQTGETITMDAAISQADGTVNHLRIIKSPVRDVSAKVVGTQIVQFDITELKDAEKALQQSQHRYRVLFNRSLNAVFVNQPPDAQGRPGRFLEANEVACQRLGYSHEELLQMTPMDIIAPESKANIPPVAAMLRAFGHAVWESLDMAKDGRRIPVEIHTHMIELNGQPMALSEVRDLTEQKRSEQALRESEHRYRSLFAHMEEGLAYCQVLVAGEQLQDFIVLAVNDAFSTMTGLEDVVGRKLSEIKSDLRETDPDLLLRFARVAISGKAERFETHVSALNTWYAVSVYSPQKDHIVIIFDVITERKRAEEQLRKLSRAVEQSPVSIVITDTQGNIEYVNPKFISVTGYTLTEVLGKNPRFLNSGTTPSSLFRDLWAAILAGREWHGELCNKKKGGELFWEFVSISPITGADGKITHFLAVKEDVTAHKRLEDEFRQAQKMEAFGRLAAGVAHDFNNMMTSIMCSIDLLAMDAPLAPSQQEAVEEIASAAQRATALTRQLLMFSRRQAVQLKVLDLNEVVENMGKMLRRLIGEDIALKTGFAPAGALVRADLGMLEQVLMNLAVNSRDAMPKGGELIINTEPLEIVKPTGRQRTGQFVRLTVSDTGCGIAPEDLAHIFEPFFTTKDVGKGTGLGLATVFGIVEQHQGWIEVRSRVGVGTTFQIHLPCESEAADAEHVESAKRSEWRGQETILLVEDDPSVRSLARRILDRYGYRILEAASGPAALAVWNRQRTDIDLLFTDVVMPEQMNGVELAEQLLKDKPELKVLYASGYTDEMLNEHSALRQTQNFIEKPYSPDSLLKKIRAALT